jgi:N-acetylglutamate synthase-like GNAT family acetyltransferase
MTPRTVLDDGRSVRIRALRPSDRGMYRAAVAGLSPRSRYLRFGSPLPKLSRKFLDQMMQGDGTRHVVYVALSADERAIVGVVRSVRTPGEARSAEVAIAVADAWQHSGLGSLLLARIVARARQTGLRALIAMTLSENNVAARLAQAHGFMMRGRAGLYREYRLELGRPARCAVTLASRQKGASRAIDPH